jgi:hypothetical protein
MRRLNSTDGAALLIALMAMMLMTALATALMLTTITETRIASSYGAGIEAFYAADAAIERAIDDLRTIPDWSALAAKAVTSTFVDGPPGGPRTLWDGTTLDLGEETRMVREGDGSPWRLFAHGAIAGMLPPGRLKSRAYVVVWVADSPDAPSRPGEEALGLLAQAYGPQGARRSLQVVLARKPINDSKGILVVSWREGP